MPKNNRDYLKRYADTALQHLENSLSYLMLLRNCYAGAPAPMEGIVNMPTEMITPIEGRDHPEYRQAVELIAGVVVEAHDLLKAFREEVM